MLMHSFAPLLATDLNLALRPGPQTWPRPPVRIRNGGFPPQTCAGMTALTHTCSLASVVGMETCGKQSAQSEVQAAPLLSAW